MSYQVLARKWRPQLFREMVGQEHVLKALINALDNNRLHHAYLFTGTRGSGKPPSPEFWPSVSTAKPASVPSPAASAVLVPKSLKGGLLT